MKRLAVNQENDKMKNKQNRILLLMSLTVLVAFGFFAINAGGGDLDPTSGPGPTMHTLDEIYNGVNALSSGSGEVTGPVAAAKVRQIAYMDVAGVPGESVDAAHVNWIEALSVRYAVTQPATTADSRGGARSANRPNFSEIKVIKEIDKATPPLHFACVTGTTYPTVDIEFTTIAPGTGNKVVYYKIKLVDATVVGFAPVMSHRTNSEYIHLEEVSFTFNEITWQYTQYDAAGNPVGVVENAWRVTSNEPG